MLLLFNGWGSIIRQPVQQTDTQYHDEQPDRHDDEQSEAEPAQDHGRRTDPRLDTSVAEVLRYRARGDRGGVLPQYGDEDEDRGHEDEGESDLGDRSRGERLDVSFGAALVGFFVPAGEGCEEDEADEGEDHGDDSAVMVTLVVWWCGLRLGVLMNTHIR